MIADLGARGVWKSQPVALFDIHVVNTDARSYLSHSPSALLVLVEAEKKRKYSDACTKYRATFTLLCFLVDGLVGDEAACFLKHLAKSLSMTWECHYGKGIGDGVTSETRALPHFHE